MEKHSRKFRISSTGILLQSIGQSELDRRTCRLLRLFRVPDGHRSVYQYSEDGVLYRQNLYLDVFAYRCRSVDSSREKSEPNVKDASAWPAESCTKRYTKQGYRTYTMNIIFLHVSWVEIKKVLCQNISFFRREFLRFVVKYLFFK